MEEGVINRKFLRPFGSLYIPRFSFWLFAVVTLSVALPVHSDPIVWNAATQFWWNGKTAADSPNGNGLADWTDGVKAAQRQSGSATSSFGSSWSYGLINCNGTAPLVGGGLDPWPDTITSSYAQRLEGEAEWDANRDPHMQFSDITDTGSGLYNSTVPSWVYRSSDVQIGWSSSTSAGAVLPNTKYVHMQPSFGGNNYYGNPSDGLAPALRWTAPVGGTYRFQGEFLPSGSGLGTMSYAILTANNPDFPDGSVPTLLSRATVGNEAGSIYYDVEATLVTGQTVTWVVGTDGSSTGDSMEVMAKVTSVTLDTKISTLLSPTRSVAFPCDGVPHEPAVSVAGSSGPVTRSFAGVDGTTYDSSTPPTLKGKYSMTYSVAEDENYQAASINVPFTVGYWNAATEFWWNAPSSEASSAAWASGAVDAGFGGRTSQSQSLWSYGLLNTTGGSPVDPYPISITQTTSGPSNRGAFGQFWDSTTSGSYTYAPIGAGGLYLYNFLGTQIGVYGTPWDNYAPGFDGAGAGRVGTPNLTHMWLQSSNTGAGTDGLASALRWTAPVAGTYRFYGEFVPGGVPDYSQSFAILKASPAGADNSGDTALLSRRTVVDDGPVTSYDITATLAAGETVTWAVGTNGGPANMMGVQAQVEFLSLPTTLTVSGAVEFNYTGSRQEPAIVKVGSTSAITKNFVGVGSTSYAASSTPPKNPGTYKVTSSVASDGTYGPATLDTNFKIIGYWNAATEFWWNAPTPENGSTAWASGVAGGAVDAGFGGRTSQSQSLWSYGLLNTTGGDPVNDPYPTSITQTTSGPSNRGAFGQFWDSTTSGDGKSYTYAGIGAGGLYLYNFLGTQIGVYGTPWFNLAPGYDGAGAGRVGTPNLTHMWLKSSNTGAGSDGLASALRWTATEAGTYRFYGEFVPGGTPGYSQSFAILKSSPAGVDNSGDRSLLSRSTVLDDGPVTSYDVTATLAAGETVTWVVGTNGGDTNMMGVQAQVEFLGLPTTLTLSGAVEFNYTGSQQEPVIVKSGSTSAITKTFVGVGSTSYATSSTPPKNQGTYKVTSSVASDGTYGPATLDTNFTINPAQLTITATAASKNQGNPDPELIYEVSGLQGSDSLLVMTGQLSRVPGEAPGTYAIQQGTLSAGGNYTISFNGALLTITGGQSFDSWSGGAPLTDDLLRKYVFGGASGPNAASEAPVYSLDGSTLSLTAIVRKNDPAIRVEGTFTTDLGNANSWSTSGVSSTTVGVDQNVPEGTERRKYSVERGSNAKKFLRLKVVTQ